MNWYHYVLISCTYFFSANSMENQIERVKHSSCIRKHIRDIIKTDTLDEAFNLFHTKILDGILPNEYIATEMFIRHIADKHFKSDSIESVDYGKFKIAQRLNTPHARQWVAWFAGTCFGSSCAYLALQQMVKNDDYETAEFLILNVHANSENINSRKSMLCICLSKPRLLEIFLKKDGPALLACHGASVLNQAIWAEVPKTVELLLAYGADPNMPTSDRNSPRDTPLVAAIYRPNSEIARILLNYGANRSAIDSAGKTALQNAIEFNRDERNESKEEAREKLIEVLQTYLLKEKLI